MTRDLVSKANNGHALKAKADVSDARARDNQRDRFSQEWRRCSGSKNY